MSVQYVVLEILSQIQSFSEFLRNNEPSTYENP